MPVAAFPLCMSTQRWKRIEWRAETDLSSVIPVEPLHSGRQGVIQKKGCEEEKSSFFFSLCINPCYRHTRYEDDLNWERVRRWDFEWNRVADIGGRHGSHLSGKKTCINTLLLTLYVTRKGRKLFGLTLNSHLCQTVHSSLSFQGRFLQLFILCL